MPVARPVLLGEALRRSSIPVLVAALAVSACASEPVAVAKWSRPGGTQAAFIEVHDRCVTNVRKDSAAFYVAGSRFPGSNGAVAEFIDDIGADFSFEDPAPGRGVDRDMFHRCMNASGWSLDAKGFAPPAGDEVPMSE